MIAVLIYAGLRREELLWLTLDDIDLRRTAGGHGFEVTKLSLLLKVLEGENEETVQKSLFAKERALPDLSNNIKCGNSLIGPDFYDNQQMGMFTEDDLYRINVFDWNREFPEIMRRGGFDAVIGNPPYFNMDDLGAG